MDVNASAVDLVMAKHGVSLLIHGHTHRPDQHSLVNGERIVLGDWDRMGWALEMDPSGYKLESFPLQQAEQ